jgi:hypothetical protein
VWLPAGPCRFPWSHQYFLRLDDWNVECVACHRVKREPRRAHRPGHLSHIPRADELDHIKENKVNLTDIYHRLGVVLGSVLTLVVALSVAVNEFVAQVAPELPGGWQDNAVRIGAAVVSVLGLAAAAIRRVTEVPSEERGILPPS